MFKHILIPTDGSDLSARAVSHGVKLAKSVGAKVTLMTATLMWSATEMASQSRMRDGHPIEEYETKAANWASSVLATAKLEAEKAGVPCETLHVKDADPDQAIIDTAKERNCGLIVMASHGRGPIGRLLLGSVALKVLTHTTTPVQIVR